MYKFANVEDFIQKLNDIKSMESGNDKLKFITEFYAELTQYIVYNKNSDDYDALNRIKQDAIVILIEEERLNDEREGVPKIDFDDIYSLKEYLKYSEEKYNEIDMPTASFILRYSDEIARKPLYKIVNKEDKEEARQFSEYLRNIISKKLNIPLDKFHSPEEWSIEATDTLNWDPDSPSWQDPYEYIYLVRLHHGKEDEKWGESSLVQFFVHKNSGIYILAEVSSESPFSIAEQKILINEILDDMTKFLPEWSREFSNIEGGDFQDIINNKISGEIRVYRMMSPKELDAWERGEIIPEGKYFASDIKYAVGSDFSFDDPDRRVYTFKISRELLIGEMDNVYITSCPTKLENKNIVKASCNKTSSLLKITPEDMLNFYNDEEKFWNFIKRQEEIGQQTLPPELSEDADDLYDTFKDDYRGLVSGEYDPDEFHSYIVVNGVKNLEDALNDVDSIVGRVYMYVDEYPTGQALEALQDISRKTKTNTPSKFLYINDICILEGPNRGRDIWQIIHAIIEAMSTTGLPIIMEARESTAYKLLTSPTIQKIMQKNGIIMSESIAEENYDESGETFYTLALKKI